MAATSEVVASDASPQSDLFSGIGRLYRAARVGARATGPPVGPRGPPEEGSVPAGIGLPERDLVTVDNLGMSLAFSLYGTRGGLCSEPVERVVYGVDAESVHGEFRSAVSVREAGRVGESRTDLVLGSHLDVLSVLLHIFDDRQIRVVRLVLVAVVMAEDTAVLE